MAQGISGPCPISTHQVFACHACILGMSLARYLVHGGVHTGTWAFLDNKVNDMSRSIILTYTNKRKAWITHAITSRPPPQQGHMRYRKNGLPQLRTCLHARSSMHLLPKPSFWRQLTYLYTVRCRFFISSYLGKTGAHRSDTRFAPILEPDLAGLPPALVLSEEFDVLRDEDADYAQRLAAAGVPTVYRCYEGETLPLQSY